MAGKKWLKLIKSLHQKKYRNEHQLFFVEGKKSVDALLESGWPPIKIFSHSGFLPHFDGFPSEEISPRELKTISALKNPNGVLGVFKIPEGPELNELDWILALDDVRNPGNLGTIIRLCDWFGINSLICSMNTVDCYNPKVLQATMGSIARVNIVYGHLPRFLESTSLPVFGAFMDGANVYRENVPLSGVLVMGNEANGISLEVEKSIAKKIAIPQYTDETSESLNVAMATGILLSEIRRKG